MKHLGNLVITKDNSQDFLELVDVTGYLYIRADASLPALTTVGGSLYINAGKLKAPLISTLHGCKGRLLSICRYGLWLSDDGLYYGGCKSGLTQAEALAYFAGRTDERAVMFIAAIAKAES
jgi:hypothetical protein